MRRFFNLGAAVVLFLVSTSVYAGTYNVTNTNGDAGAGSVRTAFTNLNIAGDANNDVVFQPGSSGTITLAADAGTLSYNAHLVNNTGSLLTLYRSGNVGGPVTGFSIGADISSFEIDSGINIHYIITDASSFYGIDIPDHNFTVNNGLNSNITVQSTGGDLYGVRRINAGAGPTFVINGGINGDMSFSGGDTIYALYNAGGAMTVNGGINGDIVVNGGADVYGLFSASGNMAINGGVNGNITGIATGINVQGIFAMDDLNVSGGINGNINLRTTTDNAFGIHVGDDAFIDSISGNITCVADRFDAIGIYMQNAGSDLSVSNGISGNITVTAGSQYAYGIYNANGKLYGASASLPLNISGNISATAPQDVAAIIAYDSMNLNITGDVTAIATGSGQAYAIFSGKAGGAVTQAVTDTVTIGGGATITGNIDLSGGTDSLILDGSSTIRNDVVNVETLSKVGGGKANLKGNVSISDTVEVTEGTLAVNGTLTTGELNVDSHGILGGSGKIVGDVTSSGTIAPGNSIGTLTIDGNLTSSGNIEIEANNTSSDIIVVEGTARVSGGTVNFIFPEAAYIKERIIHFLRAGNFVGNFSAYLSNNPILSIAGSGGKAILTRIGYEQRIAGLEASSSSEAAAKSFSAIALDASGEITTLLGKLDYMGASDLANFFSQVNAESYDAFNENVYIVSDIFSKDKQSRFNYLRHSGETGIYFDLVRSENDFEQTNDRSEFLIIAQGINIGVDRVMGDKFKAGLGFTYLKSDIDFTNNLVNKAESDTFILGGYGTYELNEKWYVDGLVQVGTAKNEQERQVVQTGTYDNSNTAYSIAEEFSSDYRSSFINVLVESGYLLELPQAMELTPFVSLDGTYLKNNSFAENSASVLALNVKDSNYNNARFALGAILAKQFEFENKVLLLPEVCLKLLHDFSDGNREIKASLSGQDNFEFVSSSGGKKKDSLVLDIGVTLKSTGNYACKLNYSGRFASDRSSAGVFLNFNFKF